MAQELNAEPRALGAALAAPAPFRSRTGDMALHAAERHVQRWAPEQGAVARSRPLASVAFVDHLIAPLVDAAQHTASLHRLKDREGSSSWVFPRPWFQDEIDWLAAGRQSQAAAQPGLLTTRGTYVATAPARGGGTSAVAVASALPQVLAAPPPMALVAPALSASSGSFRVGAGGEVVGAGAAAPVAPAMGGLAAWSPLVPFAAAQAAQVMAGTLQAAERVGLASAARSPVLEALAYVAPADLARGGADESAPRRVMAEAAPSSSIAASASMPAHVAAAVARLDAVASAEAQMRTRAVEAMAAPAVAPTAPAVTPTAAPVSSPTAIAAGERAAAERVTAEASAPSPGAPPVTADIAAVASLVASSPAAASALRGVELLTRAAAPGGAALAPVSGPRIAMPAGLGGLVAAVDTAGALSRPLAARSLAIGSDAERPLVAAERASLAAPSAVETMRTRSLPSFAPVWAQPASALEAVAAERPAAIGHVAWADRWLARFAGASPQGLMAYDVATSAPGFPRGLAAAAPESIFLAVPFAGADAIAAERGAATAEGAPARPRLVSLPAPVAVPSAAPAAPAASPTSAPRIDDDAAVPDEFFAAIARARSAPPSRPRAETPRPAVVEGPVLGAVPPVPSVPTAAVRGARVPTLADRIVSAPPSAPSAGLAAGLASSPVAPALTPFVALPGAPVFDPRALYGASIAAAYAAGLLSPAIARLGAPSRLAAGAPRAEYIAPVDETADAREPAPIAPQQPTLGGAFAPIAAPIAMPGAEAATSAAAAAAARADLVSLRSDFLAPAPMAASEMVAPLVSAPRAAWTPGPGRTAEMARSWAVEQERTVADLSFDFVPPELVLAARVYGFGPAEAAQASRLALDGTGGLAAMATAVDLTFLRAVQEQRRTMEAHTAEALPAGAVPSASGVPSAAAPMAAPGAPARTEVAPITAYPSASAASAPGAPVSAPVLSTPSALPTAPSPSEAVARFGIERRLPRGAFLWPAAAVGALGLEAKLPDADGILPIAALEILAATAVADLGTWIATRGIAADERRIDATTGAPVEAAHTSATAAMADGAAPATAAPSTIASSTTAPLVDAATAEPVAQAAALPSAQRARFEAVYLALAQTDAGKSLSPSARAARALALVAQGDDGVRGSALERAAAAWSVLPMVIAGAEEPTGTAGDRTVAPESRPGLSALAARAGDALGAFVAPSRAELDTVRGAVARGEHAPETTYVQAAAPQSSPSAAARTGLPFARHGGGEVQIPAWFESAARKMLEQGGAGDGISLAELTLIAAAPATTVAAATKSTASSASPGAPAAAGGQGQSQAERPDIDQLAQQVYAEILKLIDIARERNGEPYL